MKWSTEAPKKCGWYWVKPMRNSSIKEVVYLAPNLKSVWSVSHAESVSIDYFDLWGDKLEIPE